MIKSNVLKIGVNVIDQVGQMLSDFNITGKILYVSDVIVDKLYGDEVKKQIRQIGLLKEEYVDYNTIAYSMSIAERIIATDVNLL